IDPGGGTRGVEPSGRPPPGPLSRTPWSRLRFVQVGVGAGLSVSTRSARSPGGRFGFSRRPFHADCRGDYRGSRADVVSDHLDRMADADRVAPSRPTELCIALMSPADE